MNEHYINMRIKLPPDLHAQLLRKQTELARERMASLSLADTAVAMIAEGFLLERQQQMREGRVQRTNRQEDVLN